MPVFLNAKVVTTIEHDFGKKRRFAIFFANKRSRQEQGDAPAIALTPKNGLITALVNVPFGAILKKSTKIRLVAKIKLIFPVALRVLITELPGLKGSGA